MEQIFLFKPNKVKKEKEKEKIETGDHVSSNLGMKRSKWH